jgi:twitching motility protein PilU
MELAKLFKYMAGKNGSDLFISAGAAVHIKIEGELQPVNTQILDAEIVKRATYGLMTPEQIQQFESTQEANFAISVPEAGRFRVNVFRQRGSVAMVARYIKDTIPSLEALGLPPVLRQLALEKRGLLLVVGTTGSGKSTTLASMIDHRNSQQTGHILAIEDPIEFVHHHKKSIVNQREIGIDTTSYASALVNALREAPDVLLIGEIRDADTMRQALTFTQTGHLCLATLHANNAYHAMNRIVNFFPQDERENLLTDLALTLKAAISLRLVKGKQGLRVAATEIMFNTMSVSDLIRKGEIGKIKEAIDQSLEGGSQSFEQSLLQLYLAGKISRDEALHSADSRTDLAWLIDNAAQGKLTRPKSAPVEITSEHEMPVSNELDGFTVSPDMLSMLGKNSPKR